jgi:putative ABC transport system permease protein
MFVILIATYIVQELSIDKKQTKTDNIYVLGSDKGFGSAYKIADRLVERYPEIEQTCVITHSKMMGEITVPIASGNQQIKASVLWADSTLQNFFDFELIAGNRNEFLTDKNYAVISESFAKKAFPQQNPIGQSIKDAQDNQLIITGVIKDIKNSVLPYADIVSRIENADYPGYSMFHTQFWNAGSVVIFLKAVPGVHLESRNEDLVNYLKEIFWVYSEGYHTDASFTPFKEIYFSPISGDILEQGEWSFVMILIAVAFIILVFAIINYINLTVAQTGFRAKEMATRRLLGSSRKELFYKLINEAVLLVCISLVIGVFLAFIFCPFADQLLETKLYLTEMFTFRNLSIVISLILITGIISGLLPALIISGTKPIEVIKGKFRQQTKMVFSRFFITFQQLITITLLAVSITMLLQIDHLIKAPLGYTTHNLLHIDLKDTHDNQRAILGNELKQLSCVKRLAYSDGFPIDGGNNRTYTYKEKSISFQVFNGDPSFVNMLGITILKDNQLADPDGYYISRLALEEMGEDESIRSAIFSWGPGDEPIAIAGVIDNFHIGGRTSALSPLLLQIKEPENFYITDITLEVEGNHKEAFKQIKNTYEQMTGFPFPGQFVDQRIADLFSSQIRISRIIILFTFIALLISLLGLLAMSTYFTQQRLREVAVRKVFGSTVQQILSKLTMTFINYVLIAFVSSIPIIWYTMHDWLSGYSYRISLHPLIFMAAGGICLVVSFLTVFWQSYRAATINPAESMRSE